MRPVVRLERSESGQTLEERDRQTIDLSLSERRELLVERLLEGRSLQVELAAVGEVPGTGRDDGALEAA